MVVGSGATARIAGPFVAVFGFQSSMLALFAAVAAMHVVAFGACALLARFLAEDDNVSQHAGPGPAVDDSPAWLDDEYGDGDDDDGAERHRLLAS